MVYTAGICCGYAADIFSMAKSAMQKVYNDVVGIATVAAVVCSAVLFVLMNFQKAERPLMSQEHG